MRAELSLQLPSGREIPTGTLDEVGASGRKIIEFRYDSAYLRDPEAYDISPELPLGGGAFTPTGQRPMFGGISDIQPDNWGRRLIDAERRRNPGSAAPQRASEMEVVAAVQDLTRQGALRVQVNAQYVSVRATPTPTIVDLPALIEAARAFEQNEEIPEKYRELLIAGTSGGGARPKATVRNAADRLAIAKLPREDDFGDAMAWEATTLELARRAGVETPPFEHQRIGRVSVVTVERFDRKGDVRIGYLSADSLLRKQPNEVVDYATLAEAIAPHSASPRKDGEELFRRVAVSLLVNNIDDHMKNHGLLRGAKGWRLSPVFDVNPFYRHGSANATPVSASDDPANRDIRNLIAVAESFSLTEAHAVRIVLEVEGATSNWFEVALTFGVVPEGATAMAKAFESENRRIAKDLTLPEPKRMMSPPPSNGPQPRTRLGRFDARLNSNVEKGNADDR